MDKKEYKRKTSKRPQREDFKIASDQKEAKNYFSNTTEKDTHFSIKNIRKIIKRLIREIKDNQEKTVAVPKIRAVIEKVSEGRYVAKLSIVLKDVEDLVKVIVHWDLLSSLNSLMESIQTWKKGDNLIDRKKSIGIFATQKALKDFKAYLEANKDEKEKMTYRNFAKIINQLGGLIVSPERKIEATEQRIKDIIHRNRKLKKHEKELTECVAMCIVALEKSPRLYDFSSLTPQK